MASIFSGIRPVGGPAKVLSPGTSLNSLPPQVGIFSGTRISGLPSPSVGSTVAQGTRVPQPVLSGLPHATPSLGVSFGAAASVPPASLPRPTSPTQNHIGERY